MDALPPGLAGFVAARQQGSQDQIQQMQQMGMLSTLQQRALEQQLLPLKMRELQAKADQQERMGRLMSGMVGGDMNATPDKIEQLGMLAGIAGHPGAATLMNIADKRRQLADNSVALQSMRSGPDRARMLDPQEMSQQADGMSAPQSATMPGTGSPGLFAPYMNTPGNVGALAGAYQNQINSGAIRDPKQALTMLNNLGQMGQREDMTRFVQSQVNDRQDKSQANRIEIRNMFPPVGRGGMSGASDEGRMTDDAIADQARLSLKDPQAIRELGRLNPADKAKVLNERSRIMREAQITPEDIVAGRAMTKANQLTLNKLQTQTKAIETFENTAIRNGDTLVQLADQIDKTGIPILEKPLRSVQMMGGNPEVAKFNTQLQLFRAEAAKILTNPNLTGVLTDTARKEMSEVISGGASAKQIKDVVVLLKRDFENRRVENAVTVKSLMDELRGSSNGHSAVALTPGAPAIRSSDQDLINKWLKK